MSVFGAHSPSSPRSMSRRRRLQSARYRDAGLQRSTAEGVVLVAGGRRGRGGRRRARTRQYLGGNTEYLQSGQWIVGTEVGAQSPPESPAPQNAERRAERRRAAGLPTEQNQTSAAVIFGPADDPASPLWARRFLPFRSGRWRLSRFHQPFSLSLSLSHSRTLSLTLDPHLQYCTPIAAAP